MTTLRTAGLALLVTALLATGCALRPKPVPAGVDAPLPWGALDPDARRPRAEGVPDRRFEGSLVDAVHDIVERLEVTEDGRRSYPMLALSGGGAWGAYGAGVLCGWTDAGTRPTFQIVTGISTGALIATFAFLGPAYDHVLREQYTTIDARDVFQVRLPLANLRGRSLLDNRPLRRRLEATITDVELDLVAAEHEHGRRLFVGSTNLDRGTFVIWDLGAIASSGRPDRLQRFHDAVMASASLPLLFPPTFIDVEVDGTVYHEMHVDGGLKAVVFFRGFMVDFDDALRAAGIPPDLIDPELYVVVNGKLDPDHRPIESTLVSIGLGSLSTMLETGHTSSLYRMYVLAHLYGVQFRLGAVPDGFDGEGVGEFETEPMARLFDTGYTQMRAGYPWLREPPDLDPREVLE